MLLICELLAARALPPQLCLFPSSVIFSLTNDLMLIFIYNFHLSDIMACSGLLSEADEWKSSAGISRAEVCVGRHRAHSPPPPRPAEATAGNEWLHIHVEHMFANTFNHVTVEQR